MNNGPSELLDPTALAVRVEPTLEAIYYPTKDYWETIRKVRGRAPRAGHPMLNRDVLEKAPEGSFAGDQARRILRRYGRIKAPE